MTIEAVRALQRIGHSASVLRFDKAKCIFPKPQSIEKEGIRSTFFNSLHAYFIGLHNFPRGKRWRDYIAEHDAVLAVCGSPFNVLCAMEGNSHPPVIIWSAATFREDLRGRMENFGLLKRMIYRALLPRIDKQEKESVMRSSHFWGLSNDTTDRFRSIAGSAGNIQTLLPPIDGIFSPNEKIIRRKETAIFAARFNDPRKNIPFLLRSFRTVVDRIGAAELFLVGENRPSDAILEIIASLNLENHVRLLGSKERQNLPEILNRASLFVIPSHQEGLCISALEGMACGLPVVSTRCGGPETYVVNDQTGYLVNNGNEEEFSRSMIRVLGDTSVQRRLSENALSFIRERCTFDRFCQEIDRVLQEIPDPNRKSKR